MVKACSTVNSALSVLLLFLCLPLGAIKDGHAGPSKIPVTSDLRANANVKSYLAMRTENIVMQQYDYSCGAAALATIFSFYFKDETSEKMILELAKKTTQIDQEQLREKGLSLLDLKNIAEIKGYRAGGFRLKLEQLTELTQPVLIYYEPNDYPHFAILKKVANGIVHIADPARGNVRDTIYKFASEWDGIILAIEADKPENAVFTQSIESRAFSTSRTIDRLF